MNKNGSPEERDAKVRDYLSKKYGVSPEKVMPPLEYWHPIVKELGKSDDCKVETTEGK